MLVARRVPKTPNAPETQGRDKMESPLIHPNWNVVPAKITDGFSLEITSNDVVSLRAVAENLPRNTPIAITFLPGEDQAARILATKTVRELGFEPMPHFSARRIGSFAEFDTYLRSVVDEAGVRRCLVVAGDPAEPRGPFHDSSALIATGAFERAGITAIGIGGHPAGHPHMNEAQCFAVLETKCADIEWHGSPDRHAVRVRCAAIPWLAVDAAYAGHCRTGTHRRAWPCEH